MPVDNDRAPATQTFNCLHTSDAIMKMLKWHVITKHNSIVQHKTISVSCIHMYIYKCQPVFHIVYSHN